MASGAALKVIFFDAAGTLIHLPRGVAWHYQLVMQRWGFSFAEEKLESAFRTAWKLSPPPAETRCKREDDDREWWRTLVKDVFQRCGADLTHWREELFEDLYGHFSKPGVWELYPEVEEVLTKLRPRYQLAILSNFDRRLRTVLGNLHLDALFDPWVLSTEVGADKPSRYIYEEALRLAGIDAREALHVGDDPECDWKGAEEAGLQVFRLDRRCNSLRDLELLL